MSEAGIAQLRRRSPEVRREQIMQAAVRLFGRHGFARTTTKEIAQEAGISEGTIYKYFASKQEILFAFLDAQALQPLASLLDSAAPGDDAELIRRFLEDRLTRWQENAALMKVVFGEALFNRPLAEALFSKVIQPTLAAVESFIAARVQAGTFKAVNPTMAARALLGSVFSSHMLWDMLLPHQEVRFSRAEVAADLTMLMLDGMRNPVEVSAGIKG